MKLQLIALLSLLFALPLIAQQPPVASQPMTTEERTQWFRDARFGMYIHFGLYSILAGSYNGHSMPDPTLPNAKGWYAEWAQTRLEVPAAAYQALAKQFNPVNFDAEKWISEADNAGMKYFVITSKHHDGFALWPSQVSDYNITLTPFKDRDILMELKKACQKHGIKFGLYYSHWQDWNAVGGAWPQWSTTKRTSEEFGKYWEAKAIPQVKELITRYDPDLLVFDTWGDKDERLHITAARRDELIHVIRTMSPRCVINGRILYSNPGPDVDYVDMNDNHYPDPNQPMTRPWQTPATMVRSWGWHAGDHDWKPVSQMLGYLIGNTSRGGNYILNIGPKPDGSFPDVAIGRMRQMGGWLAANHEAIYGAGPVKMTPPAGVALTQQAVDGRTLIYASLLATQPDNRLELPIKADTITDCTILDTGLPLKFGATSEAATAITLPDTKDLIPVVKIILKP